MARERKKSQKAMRKKNVKVIKNDDSVDGDNDIVATPDVSDKEADNNVTVQYGDVVKIVAISDKLGLLLYDSDNISVKKH